MSSGFNVTIDGKQKTLCADCYEDLKDEYAKEKSCEDCKNFDQGSCTITGEKLQPLYLGYDHYFLQAEKCEFYIFLCRKSLTRSKVRNISPCHASTQFSRITAFLPAFE
jgi:hypothetical protein